jgi:hypothetical protein
MESQGLEGDFDMQTIFFSDMQTILCFALYKKL